MRSQTPNNFSKNKYDGDGKTEVEIEEGKVYSTGPGHHGEKGLDIKVALPAIIIFVLMAIIFISVCVSDPYPLFYNHYRVKTYTEKKYHEVFDDSQDGIYITLLLDATGNKALSYAYGGEHVSDIFINSINDAESGFSRYFSHTLAMYENPKVDDYIRECIEGISGFGNHKLECDCSKESISSGIVNNTKFDIDIGDLCDVLANECLDNDLVIYLSINYISNVSGFVITTDSLIIIIVSGMLLITGYMIFAVYYVIPVRKKKKNEKR